MRIFNISYRFIRTMKAKGCTEIMTSKIEMREFILILYNYISNAYNAQCNRL